MTLALWLIGIAVCLYLLDRFALWMAEKGWIYYRHHEAPKGAGSMAALHMMEVFKPELHHVVEERVSGELRNVDDEVGRLELPEADHPL